MLDELNKDQKDEENKDQKQEQPDVPTVPPDVTQSTDSGSDVSSLLSGAPPLRKLKNHSRALEAMALAAKRLHSGPNARPPSAVTAHWRPMFLNYQNYG